ncbi:MAG: hypothetical protein WCP34_17490 [Pseudomonadota bacterium]
MPHRVPAREANSLKHTIRKGSRPYKHPWDEIEAIYVRGENQKMLGLSGKTELVHEWPTQAALARDYGVREEQVSKRFARPGLDGLTAHQRQAAFRVNYQQQLDDNFLVEFAGREIRLRKATLALAELALCQIAQELTKPQGADALLKLMTAVRRAQEIGMVALNRPAEESKEEAVLGTDDWTLMREIRRGARMDPEWDSPVS